MANTVDRNALLDELKKLQGELDNKNLGKIAATAKKLAGEEDLLNLDSDPAIVNWQPTSRPGVWAGPGIPPLPAKTVLDLSKPTVSAPGVPEFKIPEIMRVTGDGTAVTAPSQLTQGDWLALASNSGILKAYTMGKVSGKSPPPQAGSTALDWMVPDSSDYFRPMHLEASVESEVTFTEETGSYVRAGFNKQEASVGFPFAAASFEREHKERQAGASHKKQMQLIGRWYYPRVELTLRRCATASARFKTAIRSALDNYDRSKDIKPLLGVFDEYGTVVPNKVIFGGELRLVQTEDFEGTVNEKEVEDVISAAVSIKTTKGEGSVGASFQNAQGNKVTGASLSQRTQFDVLGGDATLASNPQEWPNSVKPPSQWRDIGRSELTSIVEWLPDDLRGRVMTLWPKVPVEPAIWELQDTQDRSGTVKQAQFVLGAQAVQDPQDGACGEVRFVCGTATTPELGRGDAAGGAASVHRNKPASILVDAGSVFLPVPAGYNYAAKTWIEVGYAPARFAIAETNLTLDKWHPVEMGAVGQVPFPSITNTGGFDAETDGFVFCSLEARNEGDRGYLTCEVDKTIMAAASVHDNHSHGCCVQQASFCAPYTKGSRVEVNVTTGWGQLAFSVWRIPSTSQAWKFTKPEPLSLQTEVKAATHGFVNGVIAVPGYGSGNGYQGNLRLDCVADRKSLLLYPLAQAAVHYQNGNNNWISHSSAMIPVRKDYLIRANIFPTSNAPPPAQVYLTKVVPVM